MVNYSQSVTLELWKKNCEIIMILELILKLTSSFVFFSFHIITLIIFYI